MIRFLAFLILVGASTATDRALMDRCALENDVDLEALLDNWAKFGQIVDENMKNVKCWFLCLGKLEDAMDDAGNANVIKMVELKSYKYTAKLDPKDIVSLFEKCSLRDEVDPCDRAYQFHKCHMQTYLAMN